MSTRLARAFGNTADLIEWPAGGGPLLVDATKGEVMRRIPKMPVGRELTLALCLGLVLSACGGSPEATTEGVDSSASSSAAGNEIDRAFVAGMVPHHESAIEMAEIAKDLGESDFVASLADDIISSQSEEIETLGKVDEELAAEGVEPGDLGVPEHMTGMDGDTASLESADPFDEAFIDMMVPHHQGAIVMARVELEQGQNAELKKLAQEIIDAQSREIEEMNEFRESQFGSPSPAGGVPAEDGAASADDTGDPSGM